MTAIFIIIVVFMHVGGCCRRTAFVTI